MPKIYKVIGPPGTGKTEYLLRQVERACNKYFPKDLGVVSYTVASVSEVKSRIKKKLNVAYKEIPNVRTIHSHCFDLLRMKKEDVMETAKNVRAFNEDYPCYQISKGLLKNDDDDDPGANDANDIIYNQVQVLRSRMIPTDEWPTECREFHDAWTTFMEENDKLDFNGMLEQCIEQGLSPEIKVLMVDEAQDLPALQMTLIKQWGEICDTVLYAGDGNQALFRFAGSDPNNFINLEAKKVISLEQSYRLSPAVLAKSIEVIRQANVKEIVNFKATDKYGPGQFMLIRQPDFSLPGSHMILCRCNFQVKRFTSILRKANILFGNPYRKEDKGWNPLELDGTESIRIYLRMIKGEALTVYEIKQMIKNCIAKECLKHGAKKQIDSLPLTDKKKYEFFGLISMGFSDKIMDKQKPIREYFRVKSENRDLIYHLADNDPDQLFGTPQIIVGTIHSIKGGEADHVWIDPGLTTRIKRAMTSDPCAFDDECRVAYVATTRARKTVGILPTRQYRSPFWEI